MVCDADLDRRRHLQRLVYPDEVIAAEMEGNRSPVIGQPFTMRVRPPCVAPEPHPCGQVGPSKSDVLTCSMSGFPNTATFL